MIFPKVIHYGKFHQGNTYCTSAGYYCFVMGQIFPMTFQEVSLGI